MHAAREHLVAVCLRVAPVAIARVVCGCDNNHNMGRSDRFRALALSLLAWILVISTPVTSQRQTSSITPSAASPIQFSYQAIDFQLDSSETAQRHAPETMADGVALFDYNNDGRLDIFFSNGADIRTLHKTSPKFYNRLFQNDGNGHFTEVTTRAGLAGSGYDNGVAIGDYDNDGYEDIFSGRGAS